MTPQMPATCARVLAALDAEDALTAPTHASAVADWMVYLDSLAARAQVNRAMLAQAMCWLAGRPVVPGDAWEIVPDEAVGFCAEPDCVPREERPS